MSSSEWQSILELRRHKLEQSRDSAKEGYLGRPQKIPPDRSQGGSRDMFQGGPRDRPHGGSRDRRNGRWGGENERYRDQSRHVTQERSQNRRHGELWDRSGASSANVSKRNGNGSSCHQHFRFGLHSLQTILEKSPDEMVLDMTSERRLPATEALLKQRNMNDEVIVQLLKVLTHACDCETAHARLSKLLSLLPTSIYFRLHLSNYIGRLANVSHLESRHKENELKHMIKIFSELLKKQPNCYPNLPLPQLWHTIKSLADKDFLYDQNIQTAAEELMALKDEMAEKVKKEVEEMGKNPRRQRRINAAALRDNEDPPDDFRQLSVIPTIQDIHTQGPVFLRRNRIDGKYNDPDHYLDVQFRLLREDFVRPLRDGIQKLLENVESANFKFLQDVWVYTGVRVLYPILGNKGLTHMISFDVSRMKRVRWENSKRLNYGSLLCLSNDNFETFLLATVESREEQRLKQGMLEVRFTDVSEVSGIGKIECQMVETTAYFEAYRHVLEGLQCVQPETLPFQRYIVECENDVLPPAYLRNRMREEVTYDLSPIMKKRSTLLKTLVKRRADLVKISRNQCDSKTLDDKSQGQADQDHNQELIQQEQNDLSQDQDRDRHKNEDLSQDQNQDLDQHQDLDMDKCMDRDQDQDWDLDQYKDQEDNQDLNQFKDQDFNQDLDLDHFMNHYEDQDQKREQIPEENDQEQEEEQHENRMQQYQLRRLEAILAKRYGKAVRILDFDSWPSAEDLELDSSQLKAVQTALTKEFAIIQGPPGTGKTYIGLKVVKVLLHNKKQWERGTEAIAEAIAEARFKSPARPILVVCYTNHALDQFLEGILQFHKKRIIRVGGQSKSEEMKMFNISNIKQEMHKNKKVPSDIHFAVQEAKEHLRTNSSEIETATRNLRKCKENIIHERELRKENVMSEEQFESMIKPFKDHHSRRRDQGNYETTVNSVMLHWLNLLPDPYGAQNNPGLKKKPVAKFPFVNVFGGRVPNVVCPSHAAVVNDVVCRLGIHGRRYGSVELKGTPNSHIIIPNESNSFLDTRFSMTILIYVYPYAPAGKSKNNPHFMKQRGGPILCFYHRETGYVGIQIAQDGIQKDKGVISVSFNSREGTSFSPLTKAVLNLNEWNFVAASYDHNTGYIRLWHNGIMVQEEQYPARMQIASDLPVCIGSLNVPIPHQRCFHGRICCLEIYAQALRSEEIRTLARIREEDLPTEGEKQDADAQMEAATTEEMRRLNDEHENRWGNQNDEDKTLQIADQFDSKDNKQGHFKLDLTNSQKNRIKQSIIRELSDRAKMSIPDAQEVNNVWKLRIYDRWRLYRRWITHLSSRFRNAVTRNQEQFELSTQELKEAQNLEDLYILEKADVIGMTTTGAAKYRHLIQRIKPRITIVEEAAEVLESHIVTSLSPGCQHLILIGDHQQLRPNPNVYRLATDYNLDVSLFERMVKNGMNVERLRAQHRMRPEIARMMEPIYDDLENHESVLNFENIKGVNSNIFFIEHTEFEELIEEGMSRSNIHEAKYLAALCRYFILQGYKRTQITILTMYTGQLNQLKKELTPREFFQGVRFCAVDNFQGEENDIILLSLVRSNEDGNIGFLRTSNRVCVALSRAKKGFYCIGNLEIMCEQKESLWKHIIDDMRSKEKVGSYLTLMCQNHPKTIIHASKAEDFGKAPEGGCTEMCKARLECGHVCKLHCHPTDHAEYKCFEKCLKTCKLKHKCKQRCYEECDPCEVLVTKEIPSCKHLQDVPCYMDPENFNCLFSCERTCKKGHECKQRCFEECDPCKVLVPKEMPSCKHVQQVPCSTDPAKFKCKAACENSCEEFHKCKQLCHEICKRCEVLVPKEIPSCKHVQKVPCYMDPANFKCKAACERTCKDNHKCKQRCYEECKPCGFLVSKTIPHCEHEQKVPCHMDPGDVECKAPCKLSCEFGHKCKKLCYEKCDPCDSPVQKKMPLCDHYQEVLCHKDPATIKCQAPCGRSCEKGHRNCKLLCYQECKPCDVLTLKTIPSCSHEQQVPCHMPPQEFKCQAQCSKNLPCCHPCQSKCSAPCSSKCRHIVSKRLSCGHQKEVECYKKLDDTPCTASCEAVLNCNHLCKGNCSRCLFGRLHKPCQDKCDKTLFCGHSCPDVCAKNCPPCQKKCDNKCTHGVVCKKKCREPCNPCTKPCNWKCQHFKCTKLCSEPCDRPRCDKPCRKKPFKKCHHRCIGMCGEPCPKKCRVCDNEEVTKPLFGYEGNQSARFVEVQPCGHVIEVNAMDKLVDDSANAFLTNPHILRCPRCQAAIKTCARYGNIIKAGLMDLEKVKAKTYVDKKQLAQIAAQLKTKIQSSQFLKRFPDKAKVVSKSLEKKELTLEHLNTCENQIHFMNCLSELLIDVGRGGHLYRGIGYKKVMKNLESEVSNLASRVMAKERSNFSDQETEEMYSEMQRVSLMILYEVCKRELNSSKLKDVKRAIESGRPIVFHDKVMFLRLKKEVSIQISEKPWRPLQNEDKVVKVIHLSQEHWAKCPKGHVYHTDNGGAASEGHHCPECESMDSKIVEGTSGDDNHLLDDMSPADNPLASTSANKK